MYQEIIDIFVHSDDRHGKFQCLYGFAILLDEQQVVIDQQLSHHIGVHQHRIKPNLGIEHVYGEVTPDEPDEVYLIQIVGVQSGSFIHLIVVAQRQHGYTQLMVKLIGRFLSERGIMM